MVILIAVLLFRWIYGYFDFTVNGTFPERFLNLASRKGVRLWRTSGSKESLSASAAVSDMQLLSGIAKKAGCTFTVNKKHGLPEFCSRYKYRCGLLIGAVIGSVICVYMSGFIWNIKINVPDELNEYEIRRELAQTGLYEGVAYNYNDISAAERHIKMLDDRISWISINVFGTNAEVEISFKRDNKDKYAEKTMISNMISKADGTVTKIESGSGKPAVKIGAGVRKGQLLISGIVPYSNGTNAFTDSQGKVFAKTLKKVTLTLPKKTEKTLTDTDKVCIKADMKFAGLCIPLTFCGSPLTENYKTVTEKRLTLLGNDLPITIKYEKIQPYSKVPENIRPNEARKELERKYRIYRTFLISGEDITVIKEKLSFSENRDGYALTVVITTEENICENKVVKVRES